MYDLYFVAIADQSIYPVCAADNSVIQLNGNTLPGQRKKLQQAIKIDLCRNLASFAVYGYRYHGFILIVCLTRVESARGNDPSEFYLLAAAQGSYQDSGPSGCEVRHLKMDFGKP